MVGRGTVIACENCGVHYELDEYGYLRLAEAGPSIEKEGTVEAQGRRNAPFSHVPDWYRWERECVRRELEEGVYQLDIAVDICMMVDTKSIYRVGSGRLRHSAEGFHLTGCDGKLDYTQKPSASYSLYSDYYWYEIGDMICIGNSQVLYYCFPTEGKDVVAKTRLAAEELYKLRRGSS